MAGPEFSQSTFLDNKNFQMDLDEGKPSLLTQLDTSLGGYSEVALTSLTKDIINGIANGDSRWDKVGRRSASLVLSRIPFQNIVETNLWDTINNTYITGLRTQRKSSDPKGPLNQLLDVGKTLAPYLGAHIERPIRLVETLDSLTIATDLVPGQDITPTIDTRIEEIWTAIALVSIEMKLDPRGTLRNVFEIYQQNPNISLAEIRSRINVIEPRDENEAKIKRRQVVFLNSNVEAAELARRLQATRNQIYIDRSWIFWQGYTTSEKEMQEHPQFDNVLERRLFVLKYLNEESIPVIARALDVGTTAVYRDISWLRGNGYDVREKQATGRPTPPYLERNRLLVLQYKDEEIDVIMENTNLDRLQVNACLDWLKDNGYTVKPKKRGRKKKSK